MLARIARAQRWHPVMVLAVAAALCWPMLGWPGLGSSEGHRVAPAWRMLESGDWLRLEMFGQTYLRKPPGMPWAIAASSLLFGPTEFAARAVSALSTMASCLIAWWFAARWFGRPWGLAGGLAQALLPILWLPSRSAEIESLNMLGTQLAALSLIDLLMNRADPRRRPLMAIGAAAGLIIAGLAKGPAGLPCVIGVLLGPCLVARSLRPLRNPWIWSPLAIGAAAIAGLAWAVLRANTGSSVVVQDFSEFTWSVSRLGEVALFLPSAMVSTLPASLSLVIVGYAAWKRELGSKGDDATAQSLALAAVVSVLVLLLLGVSNPRYAMPGAMLLTPLAAWSARFAFGPETAGTAPVRRCARTMFLRHPLAWPVLLSIGAAVWIPLDAARPGRAEGRRAGRAIAAALDQGAEVWADYLIEARPDVLLYAQREAAALGRSIAIRWRPDDLRDARMPPTAARPLYLLLRTDDSDEAARFQPQIATGKLVPAISGQVAQFRFTLFRVAN